MTYFATLLDMPPSANRLWRQGPRGIYAAADFRRWKQTAAAEVMASRRETIAGPVEVLIAVERRHKGRDLDNVIKPVLDALQAGRAIENDRQVERLYARWALPTDLLTMKGRAVRAEVRTCS